MKRSAFLLFFAAFAASTAAGDAAPQKVLSDKLSGAFPAAEYTVSGSAVVPHKKTLSFEAGSILRFANFSGITVHGALVCKGTPSRPVIFTSVNDDPGSGTMPEQFDWNGVKAAPDAANVTLEHCVVTYSTFGINIESSATPAVLTNVSFHHNGSASLTREKRMMPVNENIPVSYKWPDTVAPAPAEPVKPAPAVLRPAAAESPAVNAAVESAAVLKKNEPPAKKPAAAARTTPWSGWRKTVRFTGADIGVAGAALWLTGHFCAEHYNGLIKPGVLLTTAEKYRKSRDSWVTARNIGLGICGAGAAAFAITFVF